MSSDPSAIPPYWKEHKSVKSGRTYYFNIITGESIWERPVAQFQVSNCITTKSEDGLTYFDTKAHESKCEKLGEEILDAKNIENPISEFVEKPIESSTKEDSMNRYRAQPRGNQQGPPRNPNQGKDGGQQKNWRPQPYNQSPNREGKKNNFNQNQGNRSNMNQRNRNHFYPGNRSNFNQGNRSNLNQGNRNILNQGNWNNLNPEIWSNLNQDTRSNQTQEYRNNLNQGFRSDQNPNQCHLDRWRMELENLPKSHRYTNQHNGFQRSSSVGPEIPGMRPTPRAENYKQRLSVDGGRLPSDLPVKSPMRITEPVESPLMKRLANARGESSKPSSSFESNNSSVVESSANSREVESGANSREVESNSNSRELESNTTSRTTDSIAISRDAESSGTSSTPKTSIQQKRKLETDEIVAQKRPRIVINDDNDSGDDDEKEEGETSSINSSSSKSSPRPIRSPIIIGKNRYSTSPQTHYKQNRKYSHSRGIGWNHSQRWNQARDQQSGNDYDLNQTPPNLNDVPSKRTQAQNRLLRFQASTPKTDYNTSQQTYHQNDAVFQQQNDTTFQRQNDPKFQRQNDPKFQRQNDPKFQRQNVTQTSPRSIVQNSESPQNEDSSEKGLFLRPDNTWGSPCLNNIRPRSRSNSQSSSMSVDSGCSPRQGNATRPAVLPTPAPASTQAQNEEETMEWEDVPTAVIVETVAEVRQSVTPSKSGFRIPPSTGPPPSSAHQSRSSLIVVLDTNVFLSAMEFVSRARDHMTKKFGYPTLFIPWQVVQELDNLKDRVSGAQSLKRRAMNAIRYIEENLRSRHPRIVFQDQENMEQSQQYLAHECNDDRILAACLQLIPVLDKVSCKSLVLVSEDVNMRNKALINKLNSVSVEELDGIIFKNKPMSITSTPSKPLSEEEIWLGDAFCSLKSKLFNIMSQILIDVLTKKMSPRPWEKGAYYKQPWDWKKLWGNYAKHWVSFEEEVAGFGVRRRLDELRDIILNHERESRVTADSLSALLEEVSFFIQNLKHPLIHDLKFEVQTIRDSRVSGRSDRSSGNHTSPAVNTAVSPAAINQAARPGQNSDRVKPGTTLNRESIVNPDGPSTTETSLCESITIKREPSWSKPSILANKSPATPSPVSSETSRASSASNESQMETSRLKVFAKMEQVFKTMEVFRVSVYDFIDMDPGPITYPNDRMTITESDLKQMFRRNHTRVSMLGKCLEEIYEAPSSSLNSNSVLMKQLLNLLNNKNDPTPLSLEDLVLSFNDQTFYSSIKNGGTQQIVDLTLHYKLLLPTIKDLL
ncbi:hypothetical protein WDU94_001192 [Cyamophila willieti]